MVAYRDILNTKIKNQISVKYDEGEMRKQSELKGEVRRYFIYHKHLVDRC